MNQLLTYSTQSQPASRRIDYWHSVTGSVLAPQLASPLDRSRFCGRITTLDVGAVRMVELHASQSRVDRTRTHCDQDPQRVYLLRIALRGEMATTQCGREALLRAGDFSFFDATQPYQITYRGSSDALILRIPRERLVSYVGCPEQIAGLGMSGSGGLSGLASRYVREMWQSAPDFLANDDSPRMVEIALQLLASAYLGRQRGDGAPESLSTAMRVRLLQLIERKLSEPSLSPSSLAQELRVTPGYLHRIFTREDETIGRYILQRRLEESARALKDPRNRDRSITTIAFKVGFNSLPHFCRVFRARFGMNPREFRAAGTGARTPPVR